MAYTYKGWTLYTREMKLRGDRNQRIYFFAKSNPKSGEPCNIPEGWKVIESKSTGSGMPYLKKIH